MLKLAADADVPIDENLPCADPGLCYEQGTVALHLGSRRALQTADLTFARACAAGHVAACYELGRLRASGAGGIHDAQKARTLFDFACQRNWAQACSELGAMYDSGSGGALDPTEAYEAYARALACRPSVRRARRPLAVLQRGLVLRVRQGRQAAAAERKVCTPNAAPLDRSLAAGENEEAMLKAGDIAPAFQRTDHTGKTVDLDALLAAGPVVLYFYPKDMTLGCTIEACCPFRDAHEELSDLTATIIGVSFDTLDSHRQFAEKNRLQFSLLADTDKALAEAFDVLGFSTCFPNV